MDSENELLDLVRVHRFYVAVLEGALGYCIPVPQEVIQEQSNREPRAVLSAFLQKYFSQWMKELGQNRRGFAPLAGFVEKGESGAVPLSSANMALLRPDAPVAHKWLGPGLSGERLDMAANSMGRIQLGQEGSLQRFLAVWWQATDKVYQECYGG